MKKIILNSALFFSILSFTMLNCSDMGDRPFLLKNNLSRVLINLNMPTEDYASNSIIDTIFKFFSSDAIANTAPASFSSVSVKVTGLDIGVVEKTFTGSSGSISLNVPAGNFRQIQVTAYVSASDQSAAASFQGTAITNLAAGQSITVPVAMSLNETKLVIPDYNNNRIVQIDDINGTNWTAKTNTDIGYFATLHPYDIDYDARGRIYIANNWPSSGEDIVIRIDNIQSTSCLTIQSSASSGIGSVAVDRVNNILYFATSTALYRSNLDGTSRVTLTTTGVTNIRGLTFNNTNGKLYIACSYSGSSKIVEYNTSTQIVDNNTTTTNIGVNTATPWDIIVRGSYFYITNPNGSNGNKIILLDSSLQFVQGYGDAGITVNKGIFYTPRTFVALREDDIIIIDNTDNPTNYNKLISMLDINGTNWATYGSAGNGTDQFYFYYYC